jgi:polysaccharide export outer membrane protein
MKLATLFILASFVPGILCVAQDQTPATKPAESAPAPVAAESQAGKPSVASAAAQTAPAQTTPIQTTPQSVAPSEPAPALAAGASANTYLIGPSDILNVTVWKEPTLSGSILVRPDGMISLPLLGDVLASGLTPLQLADQVAAKLKKFVQDPNVSVVVSQIHSKVVYMLGEVAKKGPIDMTPDMTLLQAIASAGGLSDYANTKKIYILRADSGNHQKIPVHYKQALKGDRSLDLPLKSGDTIVVP